MTLETRIQQIERRCRYLTFGLVTSVAIVGLLVLSGAAAKRELASIRVSRLEIIDELGNPRIVLGGNQAGDLSFFGVTIRDENGEFRAGINDRAQLNLQNSGGSAGLSASQAREGWREGAAFQVAHRNGSPRVMLYARGDHAGIQVRDSNGQVAFKEVSPRIKDGHDPAAERYYGPLNSSQIPEGWILPQERPANGAEAQAPYLGVAGGDNRNEKCEVRYVAPGSAAHEAGIKVGDVIVSFDGQAIDSFAMLTEIVRAKRASDQVEVVVFRGGVEKSLTAILSALSGDQSPDYFPKVRQR